jgi:hypothetical protein
LAKTAGGAPGGDADRAAGVVGFEADNELAAGVLNAEGRGWEAAAVPADLAAWLAGGGLQAEAEKDVGAALLDDQVRLDGDGEGEGDAAAAGDLEQAGGGVGGAVDLPEAALVVPEARGPAIQQVGAGGEDGAAIPALDGEPAGVGAELEGELRLAGDEGAGSGAAGDQEGGASGGGENDQQEEEPQGAPGVHRV